MQEFGGFEIRFIGNVDINSAEISVMEAVDGIVESREQIHVDEGMKRIYVDEDTPVAYAEFDGLLEEICKKIVSDQPKVSFNGHAHYSNISVELEAYCISRYRQRKKELIVESIYGEYLDGCCPECGERLFNPMECRNQETYYCKGCCKDFKFDVNYSKSFWLFKDGKFICQNT